MLLVVVLETVRFGEEVYESLIWFHLMSWRKESALF